MSLRILAAAALLLIAQAATAAEKLSELVVALLLTLTHCGPFAQPEDGQRYQRTSSSPNADSPKDAARPATRALS